VYILKRTTDGEYALKHAIQAHGTVIDSVTLNNNATILGTVCRYEDIIKLWDVKLGLCISCRHQCVDIHRHIAAGHSFQEPVYSSLFQPQLQQTHRGMQRKHLNC
jgi:hypothetical protein